MSGNDLKVVNGGKTRESEKMGLFNAIRFMKGDYKHVQHTEERQEDVVNFLKDYQAIINSLGCEEDVAPELINNIVAENREYRGIIDKVFGCENKSPDEKVKICKAIKSKLNKFKALEKEFNEQHENINKLEARNTELENEVYELKKTKLKLNTELNEKDKEKSLLEIKVQKLEVDKVEHAKEDRSKNDKINNLQKLCNIQENKINDFKNTTKDQANKISELQNTVDDQANKISELQNTADEQINKISELQNTVDDQANEISDKVTNITELRVHFGDKQRQYVASISEKRALEAELKAAKDESKEYLDKIGGLEDELKATKDKLKAALDKVNKLEDDNELLTTLIENESKKQEGRKKPKCIGEYGNQYARRNVVITQEQLEEYKLKNYTIDRIAKLHDCSRGTVANRMLEIGVNSWKDYKKQ